MGAKTGKTLVLIMPVEKRGQGFATQSLVTHSDPVQESAYLSTTPRPYALTTKQCEEREP